MAPVWQRIYESNYHKSLDHRSFYFKQVRRQPQLEAGASSLRWHQDGSPLTRDRERYSSQFGSRQRFREQRTLLPRALMASGRSLVPLDNLHQVAAYKVLRCQTPGWDPPQHLKLACFICPTDINLEPAWQHVVNPL